jgi:hypothetical protein
MSENEKQDSLFPMREEMRKNMQDLKIIEKPSTSSGTNTAPSRSRSLPTQAVMPRAQKEQQSADEQLLYYQEELRKKDEQMFQRNREEEHYANLQREYTEEQRNKEWQSRRRTPLENFGDVYAAYKADQKRKDQEIEDRNRKYAEFHKRNKILAEELKEEKLKQVSSKRQREEDLTSTPTMSPTKAPPSQKPRLEANQPSASPASDLLEEQTDLNISICDERTNQISNGDLIQKLKSKGMKASNPLQRQYLKDFICLQLDIDEEDLSSEQLKDLNKSVKIFYSNFTQKFNSSKICRGFSRMEKDPWSRNEFKIPLSLIPDIPDTKSKTSQQTSAISTSELYKVMKENSDGKFTDSNAHVPVLRKHILSKLGLSEDEVEDSQTELDEKIRKFAANASSKYKKISRKYEQLRETITKKPTYFELPESLIKRCSQKEEDAKEDETGCSGEGRKLKPFAEKSKRAQLYACKDLRENFEPELIVATAAQVVNPACGKLLKMTNSATGLTAKSALMALKDTKEIGRYTPEEALAFMLNHSQTKKDYCDMKTAAAEKGANIWPDYNQVLQAKQDCRPQGITIMETEAYVPMQNLMDHTVERIFSKDEELTQKMKDLALKNGGELKLTMTFKYGMDGCGSFSPFNQKDSKGKIQDLSSIVTSQMVPLQATAKVCGEKVIVYQNKAPNNASSCRPIRISYEKETKTTIRTESSRMQSEVMNLQTVILSEEPLIEVEYKGLFSMLDGKVLNELTQNPSSGNCPICHSTSKQMSNPSGKFQPVEGSLAYGVSPLHFGIRSFEHLYNIGYRQDTKQFGRRWTDEDRKKKKECEKRVKALFQERLGIRIDERRDGGAGKIILP